MNPQMNADKRRYLNLENYNQIQLLGNSEQLPLMEKTTIPSSTTTKDWCLICEHLRISADNILNAQKPIGKITRRPNDERNEKLSRCLD